jgi:hypothetical protein
MSKWFEVSCTQYKTLVIEVEDHEGIDDAYEVAQLNGNWDEMEGSEIPQSELDTAIRHADDVERL